MSSATNIEPAGPSRRQ